MRKNYKKKKHEKYLKVIEEVLLLRLKQLPVGGVPQRLVPEAAHIHSGHLGVPEDHNVVNVSKKNIKNSLEDPGEAPHERPVHPHQLLGGHHVSFVQHNPV